jgi:hypothetical protein
MPLGRVHSVKDDAAVDHRPEGGHHGVSIASGLRGSEPLASDAARLSPGPAAAEQGTALPGRSSNCRGDHRRDARDRRGSRRAQAPGADRGAVAHRATDQRSARAHRERSRSRAWLSARPAREGGKRREVGMDRWAWDQLAPWLAIRSSMPVGALFCVLRGPTRGRPCSPAGVRVQFHNAALQAGVRRRFAPHHYADLRVMPTKWFAAPVFPAQTRPDTGIARHNPCRLDRGLRCICTADLGRGIEHAQAVSRAGADPEADSRCDTSPIPERGRRETARIMPTSARRSPLAQWDH